MQGESLACESEPGSWESHLVLDGVFKVASVFGIEFVLKVETIQCAFERVC